MSVREFTKEDTMIVKGVAIILMLIHHLFGFSDRIHADYNSIGSFFGYEIEFLIAKFGKICVAMFIFLSAYGMYKSYSKNSVGINRLICNRIQSIYIRYWLVFSIFILIGFCFFNKEFQLNEFVDNLIGYKCTYNGEWWFLKVYLILIMIFPLVVSLFEKNWLKDLAKIITLAVLIRTLIPDFMKLEVMDKFSKTIFYKELYNAMKWLPCFLMGILFAKYNLFIKIKVWAIENKIDRLSLYIMLCVITAYIRHRNNNTANYDYLLAPMFILSILEIIKRFHFENAFRYLGKHSTNMWLVHSFFCYYYW